MQRDRPHDRKENNVSERGDLRYTSSTGAGIAGQDEVDVERAGAIALRAGRALAVGLDLLDEREQCLHVEAGVHHAGRVQERGLVRHVGRPRLVQVRSLQHCAVLLTCNYA